MKVLCRHYSIDHEFESEVYAIFYRKNYNIFKRWFIKNKRFIKNYMVLVPDRDIFLLEYVDEDEVIKIIDSDTPQEWINISKFESTSYFVGMPQFSMKMYNLSCYQWMIEEESFFIDVFENNNHVRELLYKKHPDIIDRIYNKS